MKSLEKNRATQILNEYSKRRELSGEERKHIYDVLKLIILLGISWSEEQDFEESKTKIGFLNSMGRKKFLQT